MAIEKKMFDYFIHINFHVNFYPITYYVLASKKRLVDLKYNGWIAVVVSEVNKAL